MFWADRYESVPGVGTAPCSNRNTIGPKPAKILPCQQFSSKAADVAVQIVYNAMRSPLNQNKEIKLKCSFQARSLRVF